MEENELRRYLSRHFRRYDDTTLKIIISALILVASFLFAAVVPIRSTLSPDVSSFVTQHTSIIPPAINFILICILLFWLGKPPLLSEGYLNASRATQRFYYAWVVVWLLWFLFYAYLLTEELVRSVWGGFDHPLLWSAVQNSFNNLQTASVLLCFFFLAWPIAAAARGTEFQASSIIVPLIAMVLLLTSFECFAAIFAPAFYPEHANDFRAISAFGAGVTLALFASRLGTLFSGRVTLSIAILLVYALIQTGYGAFESVPSIKTESLVAVIPLKIWLFIFVRYLITRGRLLFYFQEMISLNQRIHEDWRQFQAKLKLD